MCYRFADKPLALGGIYRIQEPVKHKYVLAGENRLPDRLRPNPANKAHFRLLHTVFQDDALWNIAAESCRRCDINLCWIGRA